MNYSVLGKVLALVLIGLAFISFSFLLVMKFVPPRYINESGPIIGVTLSFATLAVMKGANKLGQCISRWFR